MTQDEMKKAVAKAALDYVVPNTIIGIGTGSTANHFIDFLAGMKGQIEGAVASSEASAKRLKGHGIEVFDLNNVDSISVYVDGADETNHYRHLIKGGGGALTREKIVAAASKKFVCIVDETKGGRHHGQVPIARGGDPDGAQLCGARTGQARRHAGLRKPRLSKMVVRKRSQ